MQGSDIPIQRLGEQKIRRAAWRLTALGLLPFIGGAICHLLRFSPFGWQPLGIVLAYGAVIVSFMGGTVWTRALIISGNSHLSVWFLALSVMPALTGWGALLMQGKEGIILLVAAFVGLLKIESTLYNIELIPQWWWRLRLRMTCLVTGLLALMLF